MPPEFAPSDFADALDASAKAWRERFASDSDFPADAAFSGSCDAFACAVADACASVGFPCSFAVVSRETVDEDDEVVDFNPYSHAVAVPDLPASVRPDPSFDASGFGAVSSWERSWFDEPGSRSWFASDPYPDRPAFLAAASEIVPDFGLAKDIPFDPAAASAWGAFLADELGRRLGLAPRSPSSKP